MLLSVMMTTRRTGLASVARVAQACSWAGPDIEVVIRDNSGDPEKRDFLARLAGEHRNIVLAEPCDGLTNYMEGLRLTSGEFVFAIADDDLCLDHAIAALPQALREVRGDAGVCGVTGGYLIESLQGSTVMDYQHVQEQDVVARANGYLANNGVNVLQYSPMRRAVIFRVCDYLAGLPAFFSFHDQVQSLLYLMNGRFARLQRLLYVYDVGHWQNAQAAQQRDLENYLAAGFDPAVNLLHWYICGFEGAVIARNAAHLFPDIARTERQAIADRWFSTMFMRFCANPRFAFGSAHEAEVRMRCARLQGASGQIGFEGMLQEIAETIGLSSTDAATRYFEFWYAAIRGVTLAPPAAEPARRMAG